MMEKLKEKLKWGFNPRRKLPQTAYNPSESDQSREGSGDPTPLSPPRSHPKTEYSGHSSESPPPVSSFPGGVEVLHDYSEATIDICFVHGLTGNRDSTWTAHGQSTPWPKTLLPPKLSKARILTYGYDAYIVRKSVALSNRLIDHATNLLNDLTTDRACCNASSRPLIFVTHSLGGLVCKEAILLSRNNPEAHLRGIFDHIKGIIFMGTPHKGAWMADWANIPASALGLVKSTNKSLLKILETDDQLLESIQVRFWAMIRELRESGRHLEVTCFFEELPLCVVGKVVSKESATLEGYNTISIHANHRDMVKFSSAEDNGFKRLLGELIRWESQIRYLVASQPTQATELG
jgi:protein SERAC1